MVWLCWAFITPPTPGIEAGPWASKGSSSTPKEASKGSRCGPEFAGCRGLEALVPSNHPMFLPPSSLDYRTEPPVPALSHQFRHFFYTSSERTPALVFPRWFIQCGKQYGEIRAVNRRNEYIYFSIVVRVYCHTTLDIYLHYNCLTIVSDLRS
jgi:hypothetical protein